VLLAAILLKERIGAVAATALALGTAGTTLVALYAPDARIDGCRRLRDGRQPPLCSTSVLGGAGYVVWARRTAQASEEGSGDSIGRTAWQFVGATLVVSPFVLGSWWSAGAGSPRPVVHQLVAAVAVLLLGLSANARVQHRDQRGQRLSGGAAVHFCSLLAGAVTAVAVLGEPLIPGQAVGGALILAA